MGAIFNFFVATFAAIGSFLFGYDSGIIGAVISPNFKQFHSYFHEPNASILGAIVSTFAGGCFFGAAAAGWMADHVGRKRTIQIGASVAILGCSLQAGARNVSYLLVGRVIAGLAIGCLSMVVPLYQSEIAPPAIRGFLTGMTQWMIGLGFLVANWLSYGTQFFNDNRQWRVPLAFQIVPAGLLLVGMFFLPFSPRWLVEKGRNEDAFKVIQKLHGNKTNQDFIRLEFDQMIQQIEFEKENMSAKLSDLWATPAMRKRTFTGMLVQICTQWTGINVSAYFQPFLYAALGYSGSFILLLTGINNLVGQLVTFIFIYGILDRVGRRLPLIIGAFGMAVSLAIEAAINERFDGVHNPAAQKAGVAFIIIFGSVFFSASWGPVSWVYQSEIFPMRTRAMGTAVCTCSNWAMNVLISQISPIGLTNLGWKFYLVFICTNIANGLIVLFYFPETKGKTLEEMDEVFGDQAVEHVKAPGKIAGGSGIGMTGDHEKGDSTEIVKEE